MAQTRKRKKRTMYSILTDPAISKVDKKILFLKWKFNQLPAFLRNNKEHQEIYQKQINQLIAEAQTINPTEPKGGEIKK